MDDPRLGTLLLTVTALVNLGLALLVGSITSLWIFRDQSSEWAGLRAHRTAQLLAGAAVWSMGAAVLLLWVQAALMGDLSLADAAGAVGSVLTQTHLGHAWTFGVVMLFGLIALAWRPGRRVMTKSSLIGASLCVGLFLASKSAASHAGAQGRLLPVMVDWLHLMAIGVWSGIVFVAAAIVLRVPTPCDSFDRHACSRYIEALSRAATWALVGVVMSGAYSSWRGLGEFTVRAITSTYGAVWLLKMVLVTLAVALGAFNRFVAMAPLLAALRSPRNDCDRPMHRFSVVLRAEAVLLLAVLGVAAALSNSPPVSSLPVF